MKRTLPVKFLALSLAMGLVGRPMRAAAEDIDIFTGASAGTAGNPRILIVLDNTSNWARQSQQWPGGLQQGQSEARAIASVLSSLSSSVNLGLMEFVTGGSANDDGGFIRYAVKPMTDANKTAFTGQLSQIYNNINDPIEKRNSNTSYGNLLYDVYNYFSGANSYSPAAVPSSTADGDGYTSRYSTFSTPLTADNLCGKTFMIFIGNPNSSGPRADTAANTALLAGLGGVTSQIGLPGLTTANTTVSTQLGVTSACYANATAASAELSNYAATCSSYTEGCSIGGATSNSAPIACPAGQLSYTVKQSVYTPPTTTVGAPVTGTSVVSSAPSSGYYASAGAVDTSTDTGGLSCPSASTSTSGNSSTTTSYTCSYSVGGIVAGTSSSTVSSTTGAPVTTSSQTTSYYISAASVNANLDHGSLSCPSNTSSTSGGVTTSTTYACNYTVGSAVGATATGTSTASYGPYTGTTTNYYSSAAAVDPNADHGSLSCPATTVSTSGGNTTTVSTVCSYTVGAATGAPSTGTPVTTTGITTNSYSSAASVNVNSDHGSLSCPANNTCTYSLGSAVTPNQVSTATTSLCYRAVSGGTGTTYWVNSGDNAGLSCPSGYTCSYSGADGSTAGCAGTGSNIEHIVVTQTAVPNSTKYNVIQTATPITYKYTITQTGVKTTTITSKYNVSLTATPTTTVTTGVAKFTITQTAVPSSVTTTTTPAYTTVNVLGYTDQCYAAPPASTSDYASSCTGTNISCTYNNTPTSSTLARCPGGTSLYTVQGTNITLVDTPNGTSTTDTATYNADEWVRFMHDKGIPMAGSTIRPSVTTYTIDVYNKQPNATFTSLLMSMAKVGGGKYFAAKNEQAIIDALKQIFVEIQAVNTAFASTSLPVNATNRSQNENQVFIGMFRPDPSAKPRWFGNLKRYQLIGANGDLGDVDGQAAINTVTGFITPCATSYWTSDSGSYWNGLGINPDPAGTCATTTYNAYSDAPDGPLVEKGAVAEILRRGNVPAASASGFAVNRRVLTQSGTSLVNFDTGSSGLSDSLVRFIRGEDVNNELTTGASTNTRPSIHGDVIHSRPLPVNYGGSTGVTVFYGANDGTLRAVDANTGVERWAFVAPEFFSRLQRLSDNSPLISYPNLAAGISPTPTGKDYFFDGTTGVFQNADDSKVWIFPSMRRGGRTVYALDVTDPANPSYKWKIGCPNLSDDSGCTGGFTNIGQTWSTPNVAFIKGFSTTTPVVIFGGGYDSCEDGDTASPSCSSTKGNRIYIVNADTGALIQSFTTSRAVAADVALVDADNDGYPDFAYAADTGGNIYRVDFVNGGFTPLASAAWTARRVAYTNGGGRKFLFAPAVLAVGTKAYIAIGSGDREHPLASNYPYSSVTNRFYVYKDDLTAGAATPAKDMDTMSNYSTDGGCATTAVTPSSGLSGWFMNLNENGPGEQTVTSALIAAGMVTFSTNRPVAAAAGTCSTALGEARGYWVNLFNGSGGIQTAGTCGGTRSSTFVGGGLPPSPVLATGVPVNGKAISVVIGAIQRDGGASVAIAPQKVRPSITSKRRRTYTTTSGD
ncbi:PilC/PilY family type IV pilus protein [Massilia sp. TS11]|uniref:PilC/PilY family type IV pilus protein n=1 Tax=Massilia sp. TS11 TaxID=2908003 RepID=UPI001EDC399D|nr:PilC/PilY family type IV pilus protein [Massilia sp. TS11]MCG2584052.1 hypothetical protein [Massilia sp. TS11]